MALGKIKTSIQIGGNGFKVAEDGSLEMEIYDDNPEGQESMSVLIKVYHKHRMSCVFLWFSYLISLSDKQFFDYFDYTMDHTKIDWLGSRIYELPSMPK